MKEYLPLLVLEHTDGIIGGMVWTVNISASEESWRGHQGRLRYLLMSRASKHDDPPMFLVHAPEKHQC